jgi:DNA recombination protein RmuC
METLIIILLILILVGLITGIILIFKKKPEEKADNSIQLLFQQMNDLSRNIDTKIGIIDNKLGESQKETREAVYNQFSESQKLLKDINEQMSKSLIDVAREQTKTNEATRQFVTIAEQLGSLEKTLKHQKQRGNWGEASLELILSNTLAPGQYEMQYEFKNKDKVDAIIKVKEGIIPIDAKFSLDNYDRVVHAIDDKQREELEKEFKNDLKKRIDETAKYIKIEEGTLPFAFMYIPAEAIYYDLLVNEVGSIKVNTRNLIDYAYNDKKVIIVSPTTFMAYLQSVVYGFKAFKIEKSAKEIIKKVEDLSKHLKSYNEYHLKIGNSLKTVINHYDNSSSEFKKIDKDVMRITGEAVGIETITIEKPQEEN